MSCDAVTFRADELAHRSRHKNLDFIIESMKVSKADNYVKDSMTCLFFVTLHKKIRHVVCSSHPHDCGERKDRQSKMKYFGKKYVKQSYSITEEQ